MFAVAGTVSRSVLHASNRFVLEEVKSPNDLQQFVLQHFEGTWKLQAPCSDRMKLLQHLSKKNFDDSFSGNISAISNHEPLQCSWIYSGGECGTKKVEGLCVEYYEGDRCLMTEGFAAMTKLRLLNIDYARITGNWEQSFSELRWLSWKNCPTQFTPTNLRKLVVLDLTDCNITESWRGWDYVKIAESLKVLNLSGCFKLSRTPNFSTNLQLEVLILEFCSSLTTIDESISLLKRLVILNLRCTSLMSLPTSICELSSLKKLDLRSTKISQLPEKLGCLEALTELHVDEVQLPNSISKWRNLETLSAEYCNIQQGEILDAIGTLSSLKYLKLGGNPFLSLPVTISDLSSLQELCLRYCEDLQSLLVLPSSLKSLNVDGCSNLREILGFLDMKKLVELSFNNCNKLRKIESLEGLDSLEQLTINQCRSLKKLPKLRDLKKMSSLHLNTVGISKIESLEGLHSLKSLLIKKCLSLKKVSNLSESINLVFIEIRECHNLSKIGSLEGLHSLKKLLIEECYSLGKVPNLSNSTNLVFIEIQGCYRLSKIGSLEGLHSLEKLIIKHCPLLRKIPNLLGLKNIVSIDISFCHELSEIEGLQGLDSLEELQIEECNSLEMIQLPKKMLKFNIKQCEKLYEIEGLEDLKALTSFDLCYCESIARLPDLSKLKTLKYLLINGLTQLREIGCLEGLESLEELKISEASSLKVLPNISTLKNLKGLELTNCGKLSEIPSVDKLKSLEVLEVCWCGKSMKKLPDLSNLTKLQKLHIMHCKKITEIQGVDSLEFLHDLQLDGCISLVTLPCLSNLKKLKILSVRHCKKLTEIQGVEKLESLEFLIVSGCMAMKLPDLSSQISLILDDREVETSDVASSSASDLELEILNDYAPDLELETRSDYSACAPDLEHESSSDYSVCAPDLEVINSGFSPSAFYLYEISDSSSDPDLEVETKTCNPCQKSIIGRAIAEGCSLKADTQMRPPSLHNNFVSSLNQVDKKLKIRRFSSSTDHLGSPIYLNCEHTNNRSNLQDTDPSQDFPLPQEDPSQLNIEKHNQSVNEEEDNKDDIERDGGFYSKITGVKGPKCGKEMERLYEWIKCLLKGDNGHGRSEPLSLVHLLLGRAACAWHDGDGLERVNSLQL
ncbi:hypothetical protein NE237_004312 [Protea cynaroides]|uniref:Disease resistance R13L4/SHOC-2-like LRR domain-containing protein n=1 Tax=Protea cynaroides TaxID=273540 RepID=A0A9Q0KIF5_9MAGN|nr:hypothetical protein NE237_004312 [Protea cynaroides]